MAADMGCSSVNNHDLARWRGDILRSLRPVEGSIQGMITVAYELVEGRLDAVIHLTDWEDMNAKPDTAVLWREANVHNVPIAADVHTAASYVEAWNAHLARTRTAQRVFRDREVISGRPLEGIEVGQRVLAMIAHDAMKLEICRFAVENAATIFDQFDYVLATGTTGKWIRRFLEAAKRGRHEVDRVRLCNSGPYGGDVQIAYAVARELCRKVVFFQDPQASHPHDSDIRLFEQAVLASRVTVELATNAESARFLLGS
jgi:methylglyoxal synthase